MEAEECIIATEAVRYSFEPKDLKEGRGEWIKSEDLGNLREFFEAEMQIESFTLSQVAKKIDEWEVFLREKDDDWFLKLYENLCKDEAARNAFRPLPIIPIEGGGLESPKTPICR